MKLTKSNPLILIGCGASGTSIFTECLHLSGIRMGEWTDHNAESLYLQQLNVSILRNLGGSWSDIDFYQRFQSDTFLIQQLADYLRQKMRYKFYISHFGYLGTVSLFFLKNKSSIYWGWKDPRNTLTLPIWLKIFPEAKVLHLIRNGLDVAISIKKREEQRLAQRKFFEDIPIQENPSLESCLKLWKRYVLIGRSYKERLAHNYLEIQFENFLVSPKEQIIKALSFYGSINHDIKTIKILTPYIETERTRRFEEEKYSDFYENFRNDPLLRELGY